jgi:sugar lactone lactonase YvrE
MRGLAFLSALLVLPACSADTAVSPCIAACTAPRLKVLDLVAGQPGGAGWVDGVGAAAHFSDPWTLASDGARLFVADGSTIRVVDPSTAAVSTLAGTFGVVGGDDGVGADASFYQPSGMVASQGILYLTDTENHTIRRIDVATAEVTTIAGAYGVNGAADGTGGAARFREPEGLALDEGGTLYIADTDNATIRRMDLTTGKVSTLAGTAGVLGVDDGAGTDARFGAPKAITLDGKGALYVIDHGNLSLRKVMLADGTVSTVVTFPSAPNGMTRDGDDLLLSLDDQRIVRVVLDGGTITTVAGAENQSGFVDGAASLARFSRRPAGLLDDGAGVLYVADEGNYALRKITLAGREVTTFAGANSSGSADGTGTEVRFRAPQGVVTDGSRFAYVADTSNHTIRRVTLKGGETITVAGAAGESGSADGAPDAARFDQPSGLTLDRDMNLLYVADSGNRTVRTVDLASGEVTTLSQAAAAHLEHPAGLALDGSRLFITDSGSHTVVSLDTRTAESKVVAGEAMTSGAVDGLGKEARFDSPAGIVADGRGTLFVADVMNDTIRKVVIATGEVTTLAGRAGLRGSADGVGSGARFAYPSGVALDAAGNLFVADSGNNSVRRLDVRSGAVTTVIGSPALSGVLLGSLPARLTSPVAIASTTDGRLALFSENALLLAH